MQGDSEPRGFGTKHNKTQHESIIKMLSLRIVRVYASSCEFNLYGHTDTWYMRVKTTSAEREDQWSVKVIRGKNATLRQEQRMRTKSRKGGSMEYGMRGRESMRNENKEGHEGWIEIGTLKMNGK